VSRRVFAKPPGGSEGHPPKLAGFRNHFASPVALGPVGGKAFKQELDSLSWAGLVVPTVVVVGVFLGGGLELSKFRRGIEGSRLKVGGRVCLLILDRGPKVLLRGDVVAVILDDREGLARDGGLLLGG